MGNPLQPIVEQPLPPYDRSADIVWWRGVESDPLDEWLRSLPDLKFRRNKQQSPKMTFFKKLPPFIRCKIYAYVYEHPANGKLVNLSKDFTTKDVFPPDFFIAPWDLLKHAEGALISCVQLRDEIFTYFWNTYHFHVTFSPFSIGPVFSGLSICLLNAYAQRINHLTVEIDMTKLAFSAAKDSHLLKQSNSKLQKVIFNLVIALCRRHRKGNVMARLTLLARRHLGFRPAPASAPHENQVPYCPDEALYLFDCFRELKPLVLQCRMSGFSIWYTRRLLKHILIEPWLTKPRPAPIIPAWPHYNPAPPEVACLANISTLVTVGTTLGNSPNIIIGSPAASADVPDFGTTIPSFGYSQASSSAGSLIPLAGRAAGFYQVQDSVGESHSQSSDDSCDKPSTSSFNSRVNNVENTQWTGASPFSAGSSPLTIDYPETSDGTPGSMTNPVSVATQGSMATPNSVAAPCSMATPAPAVTPPPIATPHLNRLMTDFAGTSNAVDSDSFTSSPSSTSTGRMTIGSFGTPRAINAPDTGIPVPRIGTARLFKSRHGYTVTDVSSPMVERDASVGLGLGISVGFRESPSFADEVVAEMTRRHGPSLPPRKDSLPGASKSPSTIDELNEMNEMDPAFTRAVHGLRMGSEDREVQDDAENDMVEEGAEAPGSSKRDKKDKSKKKKGRKHWF